MKRAGLLVALMFTVAGCAKDTPAMVNGWVVARQIDVREKQWRHHTSSWFPSGTIRNVSTYQVQNGSTCTSHDKRGICLSSTPTYETHYSFESLDEVVMKSCRVHRFFEWPNEKVVDAPGCTAGAGQYLTDFVEYRVRVVVKDRTCEVKIPQRQYAIAREATGVNGYGGCSIDHLVFPKPNAK